MSFVAERFFVLEVVSCFRCCMIDFFMIWGLIFNGFWSSFGSDALLQAPLGPGVGAEKLLAGRRLNLEGFWNNLWVQSGRVVVEPLVAYVDIKAIPFYKFLFEPPCRDAPRLVWD